MATGGEKKTDFSHAYSAPPKIAHFKGFWDLAWGYMGPYRGLFGNAKCPHDHIYMAFWHCNVSPCPYIVGLLALKSAPCPYIGGCLAVESAPCRFRGFLAAKSVSVPIYRQLFGSAMHLHAHV